MFASLSIRCGVRRELNLPTATTAVAGSDWRAGFNWFFKGTIHVVLGCLFRRNFINRRHHLRQSRRCVSILTWMLPTSNKCLCWGGNRNSFYIWSCTRIFRTYVITGIVGSFDFWCFHTGRYCLLCLPIRSVSCIWFFFDNCSEIELNKMFSVTFLTI